MHVFKSLRGLIRQMRQPLIFQEMLLDVFVPSHNAILRNLIS